MNGVFQQSPSFPAQDVMRLTTPPGVQINPADTVSGFHVDQLVNRYLPKASNDGYASAETLVRGFGLPIEQTAELINESHVKLEDFSQAVLPLVNPYNQPVDPQDTVNGLHVNQLVNRYLPKASNEGFASAEDIVRTYGLPVEQTAEILNESHVRLEEWAKGLYGQANNIYSQNKALQSLTLEQQDAIFQQDAILKEYAQQQLSHQEFVRQLLPHLDRYEKMEELLLDSQKLAAYYGNLAAIESEHGTHQQTLARMQQNAGSNGNWNLPFAPGELLNRVDPSQLSQQQVQAIQSMSPQELQQLETAMASEMGLLQPSYTPVPVEQLNALPFAPGELLGKVDYSQVPPEAIEVLKTKSPQFLREIEYHLALNLGIPTIDPSLLNALPFAPGELLSKVDYSQVPPEAIEVLKTKSPQFLREIEYHMAHILGQRQQQNGRAIQPAPIGYSQWLQERPDTLIVDNRQQIMENPSIPPHEKQLLLQQANQQMAQLQSNNIPQGRKNFTQQVIEGAIPPSAREVNAMVAEGRFNEESMSYNPLTTMDVNAFRGNLPAANFRGQDAYPSLEQVPASHRFLLLDKLEKEGVIGKNRIRSYA